MGAEFLGMHMAAEIVFANFLGRAKMPVVAGLIQISLSCTITNAEHVSTGTGSQNYANPTDIL